MRLLKLVNTLLDFSRIESGRQSGNFSLVDIVTLTKNLSANFRSVIEKAGMKLTFKADTIIESVYVDKQMWEKIVFNLLSNAFKYTLKGSITIELTSEKDFAVLKIRDTGVGIPEEELPKMFERFHRIQNVTGRTYEGTGIGLSLIKELVLMHKGTISVESKLGEGSVFIVKIPFGKEHLNGNHISANEMDAEIITTNFYVDEAETLLKLDNKQETKSVNSKENADLPIVLIVDDNADMREHISQVLSDNFNIITAINGMDALQKLKLTTPALVLSDVMMPVMDGIELLKEIKSNKATANIPVILLTARAGEESKIEGWAIGADDYLTKPFSAKELLARIRSQINLVKLRQSLEGNVRNLFMEAPAAIAVFRGPQHVYELANKTYLKLTGNKDILGKSIRKAFPELEGSGIYEVLDRVYSTGEPYIANELLVKLDMGAEKLDENYFNFVFQPSYNSEGEIHGILGHGVDVTEQVLARKKIEESNQKIRNLIAQAPVAMCLYKGEQFIVEIVNERMLHIWDKKLETVLNKSVFEVMPEAREQGFEELLQKVYITGESFSANEISINLVRKGKNEKIFVNLLYEPYRENDGTVTGIVEVANDVTEQVLSRQKIEESDKQFNTLANNIQNLAWIADGEGWIFWYNQRWYDYTGTNLEEMQGWGWEKVHHPDHLKRVVDFVKQAWTKNEPFELTFPLRGIDGNYRWFLTRAFPVNDTEGKIISWIGTNTDIQEQKSFSEQLEKKVNERTIQLNEVNESLKEKNIELMNMNNELEAFTYISSHDLQEPLRKIQTFAGRIIATDKEHLSENAQEYFKRMNDAAERMRTLIQDLLAFSRISTLERKFEATNLNKIVEEVKEEFKEILAEKQATIEVNEMGEVKIIPFQFRQLMHNLIGNALKFAKHDIPSHIVIKSKIVKGNEVSNVNLLPQKKYCHISVSDNGIGFEKQFTEKIFQVFQKLHGKEQYSGTGIGLAIVKKIIDNHNGIITTESELGKGATFNIYLPM